MKGGRPQGIGGKQVILVELTRPGAGGVIRGDAAHAQLFIQLPVICTHEVMQAFRDTLLHLGGCLAGKGDRKDAVGAGTVQQQAQDAGHQQPGLAGAGRGMHRGIALRVGGMQGIHVCFPVVAGAAAQGAVESSLCGLSSQACCRQSPSISQ